MKLDTHDVTDKEQWESFLGQHPEANFLQSWQWGEFHASRPKKIVRRGVFADDKLVGVYVGYIETARLGTYMAVAGGPIVDWRKKAVVRRLFEDIRAQARQADCVFVRIRPQLPRSEKALQTFKELGLRPSPMYLSVELAGILDLNKPEEEIVTGMRQRLRRALRKAEKAHITIETTDDPQSIHEFYKIQLQTAGRHGFIPFSEDFLVKQFAAFAETKNALLYTARYEGEILAQNFMIFYGQEASYHYGVSTALGTKMSGAPVLHMEAMREARRRGCTRYNFWGIVDENDSKHRFYGVSVFKRGFGVDELAYTPAHDMVISPLRYAFSWTIETMRRKRRHV